MEIGDLVQLKAFLTTSPMETSYWGSGYVVQPKEVGVLIKLVYDSWCEVLMNSEVIICPYDNLIKVDSNGR